MKRLLFQVLLIVVFSHEVFSQLDTIHWIPPMHARADWGPQYLYLTTPETTAFPVSIRDGAGTLLTTLQISNTQPKQYFLGNSNNTKTLIPPELLQKTLSDRGLVVDGPKKFYAYFRAHSASEYQAGDLTCKGRAALGKTFRIGHLVQGFDSQSRRSNFASAMATEDSTIVSFSQFDPATNFRIDGANVLQSGVIEMMLQKGQSVVFSQYLSSSSTQPPNGFMGALLEASRPVAVNTGSWCGSPSTQNSNDVGIDQIAPLEQVGKEYILCRGNGTEALEHPIVIAHFDDTKVYINGSNTPIQTLNAGDNYVVPTSSFSSDGNMYIRTSKRCFLYQMIGGASNPDDEYRTAGLIFVPPISCVIPNKVDNISDPNRIGNMSFEGGLMIVAMRDSLVEVRIDGIIASMGPALTVQGNPDFVTYRKLNLFSQSDNIGSIVVTAKGAVQVAMFGRNEPASFAAFYSGFSKLAEPEIDLARVGDGVCPDTLFATGRFDGVQWMYKDSILQYGPDTMIVAYAPGFYTAVGYLGICRGSETAEDTLTLDYISPQFPYDIEEPSCFGYDDGSVIFGTPYGGFPPYQYSVDNGASFSSSNTAEGMTAGDYKLVVKDSRGCYNRPIAVEVGEPDSFTVKIVPIRLPVPLYPGKEVVLNGQTDRPIVRTVWTPPDSSGCDSCQAYAFRPETSTWVTLMVYDSAGCPAEDRYLVQVVPNIYAPNAVFLKSGTGNDYFTLYSREDLTIKKMRIYDRWGECLFEKNDFLTNQYSAGWDGYFRGKAVLPGVYVYVAEVEILPGKISLVKGEITVIR